MYHPPHSARDLTEGFKHARQELYHLAPFVIFKEEDGVKNSSASKVPVAHACNPSYSGGRNQEDCSLKPAWANSS
jgi:hypothetical protein